MAQICPEASGSPSMRRQAVLASCLAVLAGIVIMSLPATARASCSADYCFSFSVSTDPSGSYALDIPPGFVGGTVLKGLGDCVWSVNVNFGDGSPPATYTFRAEEGLSASHTFPAYGTYLVQIDAIDGHHAGNKEESCPSVHIEVTVAYPEPPPPPGEPPPKEPPTGSPGSPSGGSKGANGPNVSSNVAAGTGEQQTRAGRHFWHRCADEVLTHRVGCGQGRRVVRGWIARKRGGRAHVRVAGFTCRLHRRAKRPVACRRGPRRILSPRGI